RQERAHGQVAQNAAQEYECNVALPRCRFAGNEQASGKQQQTGRGEGAGQQGQRNEQSRPDKTVESVVTQRTSQEQNGQADQREGELVRQLVPNERDIQPACAPNMTQAEVGIRQQQLGSGRQ